MGGTMLDRTKIDPPFDPRRIRRWDVSPHQLVQWMNQLCNPNGITQYEFLKCDRLPEGFAVLSSFSHRNPWRISFYIHHPSFSPVPESEPVPPWEGSMAFHHVERYPPVGDADAAQTVSAS